MINNNAIQNLIREAKTFQIKSTMQTSTGIGMQTMETSVERLLSLGTISKDEAAPYLKKKSFDTPGSDLGSEQAGRSRIQMPTFKKSS